LNGAFHLQSAGSIFSCWLLFSLAKEETSLIGLLYVITTVRKATAFSFTTRKIFKNKNNVDTHSSTM